MQVFQACGQPSLGSRSRRSIVPAGSRRSRGEGRRRGQGRRRGGRRRTTPAYSNADDDDDAEMISLGYGGDISHSTSPISLSSTSVWMNSTTITNSVSHKVFYVQYC